MELNPTIQDRGDRKPLSRREFLYNLWASSMAVFMAGSGGVFVWFALPRFKASEFGGVFTIPVGEIPPVDAPPKEFAAGRSRVVNVGKVGSTLPANRTITR